MIIIIPWIVLCFIVGAAGSGKNIGYWGVFLLSLVLSPLIGLIIGLASSPIPQKIIKPEFTCKHCQLKTDVNSHYCPRCLQDDDGRTVEQNKEMFQAKSI